MRNLNSIIVCTLLILLSTQVSAQGSYKTFMLQTLSLKR